MRRKINVLLLFLSFAFGIIFLSGCMYLMEEDPWKMQKKIQEREKIRKHNADKELQNKAETTNQ